MSENILLIQQYLGVGNIEGYEIISRGWDYEVIIYQGNVYRFPKPDRTLNMIKEKQKLDIIAPYITINIPHFTLVQGKFITYPEIKGTTLDQIENGYNEETIATLVKFLKELHSIPLHKFDFLNDKNSDQKEDHKGLLEFVVGLKNQLNQKLKGIVDNQTINNLYYYMDELFFNFTSPNQAYVHSDLQGKNIIINPDTKQISGIIDFSDSRIGSAELDFCHFAFLPDNIIERFIIAYLGKIDIEFLERVKFLAKRDIIFEITDTAPPSDKYILDKLALYGFIS